MLYATGGEHPQLQCACGAAGDVAGASDGLAGAIVVDDLRERAIDAAPASAKGLSAKVLRARGRIRRLVTLAIRIAPKDGAVVGHGYRTAEARVGAEVLITHGQRRIVRDEIALAACGVVGRAPVIRGYRRL